MCSNIRDHKFMHTHTQLVVTTNEKPKIDTHTQKRKESKHNSKYSHQITTEKSKTTRNKKELQKQPQNN